MGSALGCVFDSRLRRSQLLPPSSVAKTPAAEMPTQSLSASAGSNRIVCRTNPAPPGFQLPDDGGLRLSGNVGARLVSTDVSSFGTTTVPTQALFFLNDPFLHERAAKFAARALVAAADDPARVDFAYGQLFGRAPQAEERADALAFLGDYALVPPPAADSNAPEKTIDSATAAWTALARVLFSSNEFLHID